MHLGDGQARGQRRGAWMDIAGAIERIVEIQRMAHGGIDQGCLWRRHLPPKQDEATLLPSTPVLDEPGQLGDTRRDAAPQHGSQGVQDIAFGGDHRLSWKVGEAGATDMLGQNESRIGIHHDLRRQRGQAATTGAPRNMW